MKQIGVAIQLYCNEYDAYPPAILTARMNATVKNPDKPGGEGSFEIYGAPFLWGTYGRHAGSDEASADQFVCDASYLNLRVLLFPYISGLRNKLDPDGVPNDLSSDYYPIFRCPSDVDWSKNFQNPFSPDDDPPFRDTDNFAWMAETAGLEKPDPKILERVESSYFFATAGWSGQMAGDMTGAVASEEILKWIRDNGGKWDRDALLDAIADPDRPLGDGEFFTVDLMPPGKQGSNGTTRPFEDEKDALYPTARGKTRVGIMQPSKKVMMAEFGNMEHHKQGKMAKYYDWDDPGDPSKSVRAEGWHRKNGGNVLFADGHAKNVDGGWWNKYPPMAGPCCLPHDGGRGSVDARDLYFPTHWKQFDATGGSEEAFVNYACYNENVK